MPSPPPVHDAEKQPLPSEEPPLQPTTTRSSLPARFAIAFALTLSVLALRSLVFPSLSLVPFSSSSGSLNSCTGSKKTPSATCQQYPSLAPGNGTQTALDANRAVIFSPEYRVKSAGIHSGLVQVKSPSFDDLGPVGEDPRWDVFYDVAKYLLDTFPLVHERLELVKVNTHGLVYTWRGSDESLKPTTLMAHQDVVPVNPATLDQWTYPPWSGHYDGKYIWGRGSVDSKNTLAATLEAFTLLLEAGFEPKRTILLVSGFDEESIGLQGAGKLAEYLEEELGRDSVAFIVDEGGLGVGEMYGRGFALPATGEKGRIDVNFTLHTPGGHSSVPPPHTGIGLLANVITSLESHPYSPSLSLSSPIFSLLQCAATHATLPATVIKNVRAGSHKGKKADKARTKVAEDFAKLGTGQRYLVSTSQAVDVIGGGVKVNALPEVAFAVVNHRIAVDSSVQDVKESIRKVVEPIATANNLELDFFGEALRAGSLGGAETAGRLVVESLNELEPAPISLVSSPVWPVFAGSIKHVFGDRFKDDLIVSPAIMTGNTDTRFFWQFTRDIYRFSPVDRGASFGLHTVDEHAWFDDHIAAVFFFHELIRNADEASFA